MEQFAAEQIGARIAEARRLADGMTQETLADLIGVSTRSIQDYERGATIPWKHMRMIGKITKRPPEWFLYGDEESLDERTAQLVHRFERIAERLEQLLAPPRAEEQ